MHLIAVRPKRRLHNADQIIVVWGH